MKLKIYVAVLATYFIVFLVPLTTGLIAYNEAVSMAEKELRASGLSALIRCVETVDSRLEATDRLVGQLSLVADFSDLQVCETPYEDRNVIPMLIEFQKVLGSFLSPESFVSNTFVCFNRPDVAVSHQYVFLSLREMYEFAFGKTDLTEKDFNAAMKADGPGIRQVGGVHLNSAIEDMLVYVHPYPLGPSLDGSVVAMISKSKIYDAVNAVFPQCESLFYIVDGDGGVIVSFNSLPYGGEVTEADIELYEMDAAEGIFSYEDGRRLSVSYAVSPRTGWRYVSALPREAVLSDLNALHDLNTMMVVICVLAGGGIVALFALRQSRVTRMLSALLSDRLGAAYVGRKRDVDKLRRSLSDIISDNQSLQKRLQDQLPLLRNAYMEKLLKGGFDSGEMCLLGHSIGFEWKAAKRILLLLDIESSLTAAGTDATEYSVIKLLLRDVLKLYFHRVYFYSIDYHSEAYIVEIGEFSREALRTQTESVLDRTARLIREKYRVPVRFSAGTVFTDIMDAAESFEKARAAMENRNTYPGSTVIWQDMPVPEPPNYTGATGKTGRAIEAITRYLRQNYDQPSLNLNMVAAKFGFTPPYLSKIFKEHAGTTFSLFLENIRIEKACRLLEKDKTIDDISATVGYGSVIAFRKAFKRLMGEPPSEYRLRRSVGMEELNKHSYE